jgi:predicted PurR-regulated permease PerM
VVPRFTQTEGLLRAFLILVILLLGVGILYLAQRVLIPLALAILLTFVLTPLVDWLQRIRMKRVLAVLLVGALTFSMLGGIAYILSKEIHDLAADLPTHTQTISNKLLALHGGEEGVVSRLEQMVAEITRQLKQNGSEGLPSTERQQPTAIIVNSESIFNLSWLSVIAMPLVEILVGLALVMMLVLFMLGKRGDLRFRLIRLIGHGHLTLTTHAMDEAAERISRFLMMQLIVNVSFGSVLCLALFLIGVPYAFLWGFLAAILRFIPYIGTWISLLFPLTLSVAVFPGWREPLEVIVVFFALEMVTANVIEPLLFGHGTGISPIALLLSAAFWAWLWGPIGLVLSTPLTVCLAVIGRYVPQLEFLDVLLSSEVDVDPAVCYYQRLLAQDHDEAADIVEECATLKSREQIYDEVLIPALALAELDNERGQLSDEDHAFIMQATRDELNDLEATPHDEPTSSGSEAESQASKGKAFVLGCPARGNVDELALHMLRSLLDPAACEFEVVSSDKLAAEIVTQAKREKPTVVCIADLQPSGLAHVRYLCKRLRAQVPTLKIAVGRWGVKEDKERTRERLRCAGADFLGWSLAETRDQIVPLLQVAAAPSAALEKEPRPKDNGAVAVASATRH